MKEENADCMLKVSPLLWAGGSQLSVAHPLLGAAGEGLGAQCSSCPRRRTQLSEHAVSHDSPFAPSAENVLFSLESSLGT